MTEQNSRKKMCHFSLVGEYARKLWVRSVRGKFWTFGADQVLIVEPETGKGGKGDNKVRTKEPNGTVINVHDMILACYGIRINSSDSLGANRLIDPKQRAPAKRIRPSDLNIIEYCYTSKTIMGIRNLVDISVSSYRLGCTALTDIANVTMKKVLGRENVFMTLDLADRYNDAKMREYCYEEICKNQEETGMLGGALCHLGAKSLCYLVSKDDLPVSNEAEVALLILKWMVLQRGQEEVVSMLEYLPVLISKVRWCFIGIERTFEILEALGPIFFGNGRLMEPIIEANWMKKAMLFLRCSETGDKKQPNLLDCTKPRLWREYSLNNY